MNKFKIGAAFTETRAFINEFQVLYQFILAIISLLDTVNLYRQK